MTDRYTQEEISERARENSDFYFGIELLCSVSFCYSCPYYWYCDEDNDSDEPEESYHW